MRSARWLWSEDEAAFRSFVEQAMELVQFVDDAEKPQRALKVSAVKRAWLDLPEALRGRAQIL